MKIIHVQVLSESGESDPALCVQEAEGEGRVDEA